MISNFQSNQIQNQLLIHSKFRQKVPVVIQCKSFPNDQSSVKLAPHGKGGEDYWDQSWDWRLWRHVVSRVKERVGKGGFDVQEGGSCKRESASDYCRDTQGMQEQCGTHDAIYCSPQLHNVLVTQCFSSVTTIIILKIKKDQYLYDFKRYIFDLPNNVVLSSPPRASYIHSEDTYSELDI